MPSDEANAFIERLGQYAITALHTDARCLFIDGHLYNDVTIEAALGEYKVRYEDITGRDLISEYRSL